MQDLLLTFLPWLFGMLVGYFFSVGAVHGEEIGDIESSFNQTPLAQEPADQERSFNIAPQPLDSALIALSVAAGVQVLTDGALTEGINSPGVSGNYTPEQALKQLLDGTGLELRRAGDDTLTIERKTSGDPLSGLMVTAAEPIQLAQNESEEDVQEKPIAPQELQPMTVTGRELDEFSYNVPNATTGTKTDTPIFDTPVSIQVVPQQVLKDQQVIRQEDALKNVSGVVPQFSFGYRQGFLVRGFETRDSQRRDGFLVRETIQPLANVDRIEVVKGPAAILYGTVEPGGLINLVSKRPQTEPYYSLSQQFGSFDTYRTLLDATGPLNTDGSLSYRLNFEYFDQNNFRDFVSIERKLVAPSFTWRNDNTQVDLDFMYQDEDNFVDDGIPAIGDRPAKVPRSRFLGEAFSDTNTINRVPALTVTHQFNDNWKIKARYQAEISDGFYTDIGQFDVNEATGDADRFSFIGRFDQDSHYGTLDLTGKFSTWDFDHTVLIGGEYYYYKYLEIDNFFDSPPFATPINIFNPIYGTITDQFKNESPNDTFGARQEWYGLFFQDQIALGEQWHLLAGFRYDNVRTTQIFGLPSEESPTQEADEVSSRVGLLYHPVPWLSLFGSYTEGLNVPTFSDTPEPQLSRQYEAGLKAEFLDGRISGTLTYFNLTKTNIQTPTGIPNVFDLTGEVQNQGMEIDLNGALTDNWRVIGSFSYTDSEITKDQDDSGGPGNQGNRAINVPRYTGSLWTVYEFGDFGWPGLTAGVGGFFVSQREGDNENTFQLPGYGRVDLMLGYARKIGLSKVSLQFNIENLTDKEYFASSFNRLNIAPGTPRTFLGQVRVEF